MLTGGDKYTYHLDLNGRCIAAVFQLLGAEYRGSNCGFRLDHTILPWGEETSRHGSSTDRLFIYVRKYFLFVVTRCGLICD